MTTDPKINAAEEKPQNPLDFAGKNWDVAITRVDAHARKCKRCYKRNSDKKTTNLGVWEPCRPCKLAKQLYKNERDAMEAYRKAGGKLPVPKKFMS